MTGSGRKASCRKGSGSRQPIARTAVRRVARSRAHRFKGREAHQAGKGQGEFGKHLPALDRNQSSAEREQAIDRHRHVLVAGAHDADVVAVVTDRGGERPPAKAKAFDKAAADIAVAAMALEHADLEQIVLGSACRCPSR